MDNIHLAFPFTGLFFTLLGLSFAIVTWKVSDELRSKKKKTNLSSQGRRCGLKMR